MTRVTQVDEPAVAGPDRAVVHVVGVVRDDVAERRRTAQARGKRAERPQVAALARLGGDASEVTNGLWWRMYSPVPTHVAAPGQPLEVALPSEPAPRSAGARASGRGTALAAIAGAPVGRARDHRQVVRQAGMGRRRRTASQPGSDARPGSGTAPAWMPEDLSQAVVLHHEHPRVVRSRHSSLGRRRADHEGCRQTGEDARSDSWGPRHHDNSQPGARYSETPVENGAGVMRMTAMCLPASPCSSH